MAVTGPVKVEPRSSQEYRSISVDSYSSLKKFSESPLGYYKEFILGEKPKDKKGDGIILGDLVDCLLFTPEDYHIKFEENNAGEIDRNKTTQIGLFTLELFDLTQACMNEEGVCTREFEDLAQEAFNKVKFDWNGEEIAFKKKELSYAIEKFQGSKFEEWYKVQRTGINKTIIDINMKSNADKIVQTLLYHPLIGDYFKSEGNIETLYQVQVEFDLYDLPFKSMFDIVRIDHTKKTIQPIDLKVSWEVLSFEYNFYKMKYWIQAACYQLAIAKFVWNHPEYSSYKIETIQYLVADSTNQYEPLLYTLNKGNIEQYVDGFSLNGKWNTGIFELTDNLIWAKQNGFRVSKNDYTHNNTRQIGLYK